MAGQSRRSKLKVTVEELESLQQISRSPQTELREAVRAGILLRYHTGESITSIARSVRMTRKSVAKWITRALAVGATAALKDAYHRPKGPVITEQASAWVVSLACLKPKDLGYAAELWTRSALAQHVRTHAVLAGHPSLAKAAKATIQRILAKQELRPEQIRHYRERRDPQFDEKIKNILLVYKTVTLQNEGGGSGANPSLTLTRNLPRTVSLEVASSAHDLPSSPVSIPAVERDHEHEPLDACSILAALDLQDGHIIGRVERRHRSSEFIALLQDLDAYYPPECTIRIILDNHAAHSSKETYAYLETRPNRFRYVLMPKHGFWLNIVETLFGKMARTFLNHLRVYTWEELRACILLGIAQINAAPALHRWGKFEDVNQPIFW